MHDIGMVQFTAGQDINPAENVSKYIGPKGRLLGVMMNMNFTGDAAQLIFYLTVGGLNVPILTIGTTFAALCPAGNAASRFWWFGIDRGYPGDGTRIAALPNSIENNAITTHVFPSGQQQGSWPLALPPTVDIGVWNAPVRANISFQLLVDNLATTSFIFSKSDDTAGVV
jgi:hypothetical protein